MYIQYVHPLPVTLSPLGSSPSSDTDPLPRTFPALTITTTSSSQRTPRLLSCTSNVIFLQSGKTCSGLLLKQPLRSSAKIVHARYKAANPSSCKFRVSNSRYVFGSFFGSSRLYSTVSGTSARLGSGMSIFQPYRIL